jgi:hypothetical protein
MQALNLPDHGVKTKHAPEGERIFDFVRRMWVLLTPEEWVRQHVLNFLVQDLGCPASLIAVEKKLVMNRLTKRTDILVHTAEGKPVLLVECKAPQVKLGQEVFEQAARYNTVFKVPFLLVTNGMVHYCCKVVHGDGRIEFLSTLPSWPEMSRALSG